MPHRNASLIPSKAAQLRLLAWQFCETYSCHSGAGMYHDSVIGAPVKFMSNWAANLFLKLLLSFR